MQNTITFKKILEDSIVESLESHSFVLNSFQNILETVLTSEDINLSEERFSSYVDKYIEAYVSYKVVQDMISHDFVPVDRKGINWNLEYYNKNFVVTIEECTDEEKDKMLEWGFEVINE